MNADLRISWLQTLGVNAEDHLRLRSPTSFVGFSLELLSPEQLGKLDTILVKEVQNSDRDYARKAEKAQRDLKVFAKINTEGMDLKISDLTSLRDALKAAIGATKHKWVFMLSKDGQYNPFFVKNIEYESGRRGDPAHTDMDLIAICREEQVTKTINWCSRDLLGESISEEMDPFDFEGQEDDEDEDEDSKPKAKKKSKRAPRYTLAELLDNEGVYLETEELVVEYLLNVGLYKKMLGLKRGKQFYATGSARSIGRSWYGGGQAVEMVRDGMPTKVVMDDDYKEDVDPDDYYARRRNDKKASAVIANSFWKSKESTVLLPIHLYFQIFDLDKHSFLECHVTNLVPYVFNTKLDRKLVLPAADKELVSMLISNADELMDDIIAGKSGGIIVLGTGKPGVGKTLTAEVYSEVLQKPLYTVQCSQLGTDEETLEKKLRRVLHLASRWGAILLLDEADVYVRERGSDIQQNAIVGVFLRLLEYYRGVLFMTSNRALAVDDAILSRLTAWIRYSMPDKANLRKIWQVLSEQFEMKLSEKLLDELLNRFPKISGRNVKNLLKLGRLQSRKKKEELSIELFTSVAQFQDIEQ